MGSIIKVSIILSKSVILKDVGFFWKNSSLGGFQVCLLVVFCSSSFDTLILHFYFYFFYQGLIRLSCVLGAEYSKGEQKR